MLMKKFLSLFLCLTCVLTLVACGKKVAPITLPQTDEITSIAHISRDIKNQCFTWAGIMLVGAVLSYFLTPYMAIPAFIIWLVLFFKEVHFDTHKAFEKYLLK